MVPPLTPGYELWFTTSTHTKPISFLTFSNSGELLASGDDEGQVFIWSLGSGQCFQELHCPSAAVSSCWGDDKELFIGCGNGEIHLFEHSTTQNRFELSARTAINETKQNVTALSVHGNRLAACSGKVVHCLLVEHLGLRPYRSWEVEKVREMRSVHFLDRQTILSASLREGVCVLLDINEPSRPLWQRKLGHRIGESAMSPDNRFFLASDLAGSVQMYQVTPTGLRAFRTFSSPVDMSCNYPLQVSFAEGISLVVSGSGCGEVRIWDTDTQQKTVLLHGRPMSKASGDDFQLTQAVAAHTTPRLHLLASACSRNAKHTIKIWKRPNKMVPNIRDSEKCDIEDGLGLILARILIVTAGIIGTIYLLNLCFHGIAARMVESCIFRFNRLFVTEARGRELEIL